MTSSSRQEVYSFGFQILRDGLKSFHIYSNEEVSSYPFASIFDNEDSATDLRVKYPYFQGREPLKFEFEGSYASGDTSIGINPSYE